MTHSYKISGMTCYNCQVKVQKLLSGISGVTGVRVDQLKGEAEITMQQHIPLETLQDSLKGTKYQIAEKQEIPPHFMVEEPKSWIQTYKPVVLLFVYITGASFLAQSPADSFSWMLWMRHFMTGFFLTFSFFKILNISGFADSYSTYDIIARRWRGYSFLYAFIELMLGVAFLIGFHPFLTNVITFIVMSISLIGVLQSVLNKKKIRCACLGDVFNLPMSTITIIEDALMIGMSAFMIIYLKV